MLRFRMVIKQNYIDFALYFALKFQTNDFGLHLSEMNIVISTLDSDLLLSLGTGSNYATHDHYFYTCTCTWYL